MTIAKPFVGGSTVLFDVLHMFQVREVLINDTNVKLINTYTQIRENIEKLIEQLFDLQNVYRTKPCTEQKSFFMQNAKERTYKQHIF
ncbi:MAG: DNA adenine methylase [Treponema sp.]|nr:DNA adenine methylase [Treponema sp.]